MGDRVSWEEWRQLLSRGRISGCILANEFLDALPVHLVEWSRGRLQEVYVRLEEDGSLGEALGEPSSEEVARYFDALDVDLAEGQRAEVNLAAPKWIAEASALLETGYAIVIDYGQEAAELYSERHYAGTLLGYRRHQLVVDPLSAPGEHDLTSHVDFTSLVREGIGAGFGSCSMTSQRRFLVAMGLAEMIAALAVPEGGEAGKKKVQRRFALHALMSPSGMGETFRVLLFGKGAPLEGLQCLRDPFRAPVEAPGGGV
jgi:SAM-dependent MidA family methyltransferase